MFYIMNKHSDIRADRKKKLLISNIMLGAAAVLLITGIVMLSVDIIKRNIRKNKLEEGAQNIVRAIEQNRAQLAQEAGTRELSEPQATMVVDVTGLEVNGEENDFVDYEAQAAQAALVEEELDNTYTGQVTLIGLGLLEIPSIDLRVPMWETTNSITLRYGVGHYVDSVMPGEAGNCTVMGHHMREYGSIFNRLEEVDIGDELIITDLEGMTYTYIVDELETVTAEEMLTMIEGDLTDTTQLTLVTCVYRNTGKMRLLVIGHIAQED